MDYRPPGSSCPWDSPGKNTDSRIELASLTSLVLAGGFFTTSATWRIAPQMPGLSFLWSPLHSLLSSCLLSNAKVPLPSLLITVLLESLLYPDYFLNCIQMSFFLSTVFKTLTSWFYSPLLILFSSLYHFYASVLPNYSLIIEDKG